MEWAILVAMAVLICPLMMIGMIFAGWLMGRRSGHGADHSGHGMGCMGHAHGSAHSEEGQDVLHAGQH